MGKRALLSVPLLEKEACYGAIFLERAIEQPFTDKEREDVEALSNFIGVVVEEKRQSSLPLYKHFFRSVKNQFIKIV